MLSWVVMGMLTDSDGLCIDRGVNEFFFFKQKTAYEMLRSLVGSEMCIRDRPSSAAMRCSSTALVGLLMREYTWPARSRLNRAAAVSYTHLTLPTIYSV